MVETGASHRRWAMESLMQDEFFPRMKEEDCRRIIQEAIDFGAHIAQKTREKLGSSSDADSIREMLVSLGCSVRIDEVSELPGTMSEYEEDLLVARFYTLRVRQRAAEAIEREEWSTGWYELYAQCVARELFHHVENTLSGKASHHIRFPDRFLGIFPISRPVEAAREIACLVFVRDFLELADVPMMMRDA